MLAWGHQFVFKALISPDCCTDATHTHAHRGISPHKDLFSSFR